MHKGNSIFIRAPRERIFETVRDLSTWPEILPHYRWVRFTGAASEHRIVQMAATCSGLPISWTSEYWTDEQQLELHFMHLKNWTKGMKVIWTLTPTRDGTRVEIVHDLKFRVPALAWLAEPIIGDFFVSQVAGKTLETFKAYLEKAEGE
jgi:ribosome-associated toxin RatA of RatAB toxin-antitoxin module